jgi:hypothetical protein
MTRYRIPTHLTVEPSLLRAELGPLPIDLTFRQATVLACAAGVAYWLWQGSGLPRGLVIALALAALVFAVVLAFVTIGGRSADRWLHDALHYAVRPRRLVWAVEASTAADDRLAVTWTDAPLHLAWSPSPPANASAPPPTTAD